MSFKINPVTVPEGACIPGDAQSMVNFIAQNLQLVLSTTFTGLIVQQATPDAVDRDKAWLRLGASGEPIRLYSWYAGFWVSQHAIPTSDKRRYVVENASDANIRTIDLDADPGAIPATEFTGPFWEVDTDYAGRMIIAEGTLTESGLVLTSTDEGGSDEATLTALNMASHTHTGKAYYAGHGATVVGDPSGVTSRFYHETSGHTVKTSDPTLFAEAGVLTDPTGDGEAFSIMPPYRVVRIIKRTIRKWHTV